MSRKPISYSGYRILDGTVDNYASLLDPQKWKVNAPLLWQESGIVNGPLPTDRDTDPAVEVLDTWAQPHLFFENVTFGFVSSQRNLLRTTYTKSPARVRFFYEQFECLSSVFFFQENAGGIDVDTGEATLVQQPQPNKVRLDISKSVRFTQPSDELPVVDLVTSIAVQLVMDLLLYGIVPNNPNGEA